MEGKTGITLAMLWLGAIVLISDTTWVVAARDFIRGKLVTKVK